MEFPERFHYKYFSQTKLVLIVFQCVLAFIYTVIDLAFSSFVSICTSDSRNDLLTYAHHHNIYIHKPVMLPLQSKCCVIITNYNNNMLPGIVAGIARKQDWLGMGLLLFCSLLPQPKVTQCNLRVVL